MLENSDKDNYKMENEKYFNTFFVSFETPH